MKLLLVEDELRMAAALTELLRMEQYEVDHVADGKSALSAIESGLYDIVILDVMIPEPNGFEVARAVRRKGITVPILMLTAKAETDDKIYGLDCGADDYLTKPFLSRELVARLRALQRRSSQSLHDMPLIFGDIRLDTDNSMIICTESGQSVRLGEKEFRILECMITNRGKIITRQQIVQKVWGFDNEAEYNNVEVYMSFTRRKLSFIGSHVEIKAVRGVGYELRYSDV